MKPTKAELKKAKNLLNKYAPKGEELAYINSKEATLLKKIGGAGKDINGTGIKSYRRTDANTMSGSGMGAGSSSSNGDNDDNFNASAARFSPQRSPNILSRAATAIGNYIKSGGVTGMLLTAAGNSINRSRTNSQLVGTSDYQGGGKSRVSTTYQSDNDNRQTATNVGGKIIKLSPTSAEVSQSKATDVTYDSRKTKARGRSMTIRTNSRGIGNNMSSVLGKKSLLGAA